MALELELGAVERKRATVTATADPTGGTIEWGFVLCGSGLEQPAAYTAGQWAGAWSASLEEVEADTPLLGKTGSGAAVELAEGRHEAWARFTDGDSTFVRQVDQILVR